MDWSQLQARTKRSPLKLVLALLAAFLQSASVTFLTELLLPYLDLVNIALLYLLNVVLIAVWMGRWPAVFGALISSLSFAHVFVPPRYSLAITEPTYLITAVEMLAVALITGHLTAGLAAKAEEAAYRESTLQALYTLASQLAGALNSADVEQIIQSFLASSGWRSSLFVADQEQNLNSISNTPLPPCYSVEASRNALERGEVVEVSCGQILLRYFPLRTAKENCGVMLLEAPVGAKETGEERSRFVALASLVAVTLERVHFADVARDATLKAETEQLRSSLLSALSHDIRTPLTSVIGLADTLTRSNAAFPATEKDMLAELHGQALHMNWMVNNLLDMARLQAGRIVLKREWQPLEEVIGSSLEVMRSRLSGRKVTVALEPGLPLLEFDAVLIERVICNLLENAAKYAPEGEIRLEAARTDGHVAISVIDQGPGIASGDEGRIFDLFVQGRQEASNPGVGLGLAICRSIIQAHGGSIRAENRAPRGATFTFTLPIGDAPEAEEAPINEPGGLA